MPLLFILLIVLPIAELYVLIQVAHVIGLIPSLVLLFGISIAGAWLLKREGMATWRRLQETLRRGEMPGKEVADGALILLGGALLLTPGFISDAVGFFLVLPPTRALVKSSFRRFMGGYAMRRAGVVGYAGAAGKRAYEARVTRTRRTSSDVEQLTQTPPSVPKDETL